MKYFFEMIKSRLQYEPHIFVEKNLWTFFLPVGNIHLPVYKKYLSTFCILDAGFLVISFLIIKAQKWNWSKTMFCVYYGKKYQQWQWWLNDNYDGDNGDFDVNDEENDQKTYNYHDFWVKVD